MSTAAVLPPVRNAEPAPPAQQVAEVIVRLQPGTANTEIVLHLQPNHLGTVHIHITRDPAGSCEVVCQPEKPETLILLQQNVDDMHHALDRAGVERDGRTITFSLADPPAPATALPTTAATVPGSLAPMAPPQGASGGSDYSQPRHEMNMDFGDRPDRQPSHRNTGTNGTTPEGHGGFDTAVVPPSPVPTWQSNRINITA